MSVPCQGSAGVYELGGARTGSIVLQIVGVVAIVADVDLPKVFLDIAMRSAVDNIICCPHVLDGMKRKRLVGIDTKQRFLLTANSGPLHGVLDRVEIIGRIFELADPAALQLPLGMTSQPTEVQPLGSS
jgi:hypothetical protein